MLRIGLDIHGVIDRHPQAFRKLAGLWISQGYEIHIVTGQERLDSEPKVRELNIPFTHFHSIVDFHRAKGTHMWKRTDGGGWWMERDVWLATKGLIAEEQGLHVHFDDQIEYAPSFPTSCSFILVKNNFSATWAELFT